MAAVIPEEGVSRGHGRGAHYSPVELEIDGTRAGVLKVAGKLPVGPERPSPDAQSSGLCRAVNGEVDLLRNAYFMIGRFDGEFNPAAVVLELWGIGSQAPFFGNGQRPAAAGQIKERRRRKSAARAPQH